MRDGLILDTCALVWLACDSDRLSSHARGEIDASRRVYVSAISAWEISLKAARGTLELPMPAARWFERALDVHSLTLADLSVEVLVHANELPWHHRDPADRFIIATAQLNDLTVVTDDRRFDAYGVETIR